VAAITATIGWDVVDAVEIGNEVEIFHDAGVRPNSWTVKDYEVEFVSHVTAMEAAGMPRGLIQGFVLCCNNSDYDAEWPNYAQQYGPVAGGGSGFLKTMSYHHYAVGGCGGKTVTVEQLLSESASTGGRITWRHTLHPRAQLGSLSAWGRETAFPVGARRAFQMASRQHFGQ
jgi:hypothetical protein